MKPFKRLVAVTQWLLLLPACLFMTALIVRLLQPADYPMARASHLIVMWYSLRMWTLWVLLIALPLAVLVSGCAALLFSWNKEAGQRQTARHWLSTLRAQKTMLFITTAALTAGVILAVVVVHMLMN